MIFLDMLQNVTQYNLLSMETLSQDNFYHWKTSGKSSELGELNGKGESCESEFRRCIHPKESHKLVSPFTPVQSSFLERLAKTENLVKYCHSFDHHLFAHLIHLCHWYGNTFLRYSQEYENETSTNVFSKGLIIISLLIFVTWMVIHSNGIPKNMKRNAQLARKKYL